MTEPGKSGTVHSELSIVASHPVRVAQAFPEWYNIVDFPEVMT